MPCLTNVITSRLILHELLKSMTPEHISFSFKTAYVKILNKEHNSIIMQLGKKTYSLSFSRCYLLHLGEDIAIRKTSANREAPFPLPSLKCSV